MVFVAGDAVLKADFGGESALGEEFEGAVDGGHADFGVALADEAEEFVHGHVVASVDEGLEDGVALFGVLESDLLEVAVEALFCLGERLGRDGVGVVYPTGRSLPFEVVAQHPL